MVVDPKGSEIRDIEDRVSHLTFSISKTIPLGLFGFLIVQTASIIWWTSSFHQKFEDHVNHSEERHTLIKSQMGDRYRAQQAKADFALRDERINRNATDVGQLKSSIAKIDEKLDDRFDKLFEYLHKQGTSKMSTALLTRRDAP